MPLNKEILKSQLTIYFQNNNKTAEEAAADLSEIIDSYIRTATVSTIVTGTSATGGPVTGSGSGGLS